MARKSSAKSKGKGKKKSTAIKVDLSDVESKVILEEGDYLVTVAEVEQRPGDEDDYLSWKFEIEGGGVAYENTSLSPKALWKLRTLLESMGYEIPDKAFSLDLEELVGLTCGASIGVDVFNNKKKNVIIDTFPEDELDEEDEEEDKPSKSKGKGKSSKKSKKQEEEDDEDEEEEDDDDEDEEEEEVKPKKKGKGKSKSKKSKDLKKGDEVTFEDDGEEYEGTLVKINKKKGSCEVEVDDEVWELELSDVSAA